MIKVKKKTRRRKYKLSARQLAHRRYIRSDKWKKKKDEFRASSFFRGECFICKKTWKLQIHHLTYDRLFNELPEDLVELCSHDHKMVHKAMKNGITWNQILKNLEIIYE